MATKAKAQTKTTTESTSSFEDAATRMQEQYFSALEQGQKAILKGYEAMFDAMSRFELPAIPGVDMDAMRPGTDAFDGLFDFSAKVIDNQREFAHKMLAVSAKA